MVGKEQVPLAINFNLLKDAFAKYCSFSDISNLLDFGASDAKNVIIKI